MGQATCQFDHLIEANNAINKSNNNENKSNNNENNNENHLRNTLSRHGLRHSRRRQHGHGDGRGRRADDHAPLALDSDVTISAVAGSSLTLSGAVNGNGHTLIVNGPGDPDPQRNGHQRRGHQRRRGNTANDRR